MSWSTLWFLKNRKFSISQMWPFIHYSFNKHLLSLNDLPYPPLGVVDTFLISWNIICETAKLDLLATPLTYIHYWVSSSLDFYYALSLECPITNLNSNIIPTWSFPDYHKEIRCTLFLPNHSFFSVSVLWEQPMPLN